MMMYKLRAIISSVNASPHTHKHTHKHTHAHTHAHAKIHHHHHRHKKFRLYLIQTNCKNICNTWTQSEFCTWQNCVRGQEPRKCIYSVPAQETAKHPAKFGWPPVSDVGAVTKPRRKTVWNLLGCPKLPNRSQPLVVRCSPYC